jgi:Alcohol dehydrogenase GroES-associated/Alcohol dehydrogenase GroES-like domain
MKALVYRGPKDVRIENVPDAKIEQETDCLVKITSTNICGSDLHMYEGRTSVEQGKVLGHENLVSSSRSAARCGGLRPATSCASLSTWLVGTARIASAAIPVSA